MIRNDIRQFADAVRWLGYSRNIGTGKVMPLPPNPDGTVARYRHVESGRGVCVWPIQTIGDANEVGEIAAKHGFKLIGYGRPQPAQATSPYLNRPRRTLAQAIADTGRTPLQTDADAKAGRLRALATEAANNAAAAAQRGDDKTAHMYHDDAEALSHGAAALEAKVRKRGWS
jgi:hypothetical protein